MCWASVGRKISKQIINARNIFNFNQAVPRLPYLESRRKLPKIIYQGHEQILSTHRSRHGDRCAFLRAIVWSWRGCDVIKLHGRDHKDVSRHHRPKTNLHVLNVEQLTFPVTRKCLLILPGRRRMFVLSAGRFCTRIVTMDGKHLVDQVTTNSRFAPRTQILP